jgi:hypothetical protein
MDDEQTTKNLEKDVSRQSFPTVPNDSTILQPFWVRCGSVWTNLMDRKFMESQLCVVLYCGTIFWVVYLLSQIV